MEKEAYTIIYTVERHWHYLTGKKFLLRVDNRVENYLNSKRVPKNRKLEVQHIMKYNMLDQ